MLNGGKKAQSASPSSSAGAMFVDCWVCVLTLVNEFRLYISKAIELADYRDPVYVLTAAGLSEAEGK